MTNNTASTWFITGASAGIGSALAHAAAERGDNVVALARDVGSLDPLAEEHGNRVLALAVDVRRQADVEDAVVQAVEAFGRIDYVHNNAGYGLVGAVEESTDEQARGIFDTNVFGVLNVLRATLPVLRAQGAGHILQGSSWFGRATVPGVGLISATKFAVEGMSLALAEELEPLGIKVTMVEPGPTATGFGASAAVSGTIDDYDQILRADSGDDPPANAPDRVAAAIIEAVGADRPPLRLVTGEFAVGAIRAELQRQLDELDAWAPTSRAVDSPMTTA